MSPLIVFFFAAIVNAAPEAPLNPFFRSSFLGPQAFPTFLSTGQPSETPEVAAARAFHEAEHARARALVGPTVGPIATPGTVGFPGFAPFPNTQPSFSPSFRGFPTPTVGAIHYRQQPSTYRGPLAKPTILPSGFLEDTPEVVAARNSHLSELNRASGGFGFFQIPVSPQGFLSDTPEVAAARNAHLAEHARVAANSYQRLPQQQRFFK